MPRVLDISDGFSSNSEPAQGSLDSNSYKSFANDAAFVADKGSAAANSDTYYNTTDHKVRYYKNGAWTYLKDELNVVSKTTTYTAALTDDIILCSATAAWVLTLPTAVGNEGKEYVIKKTDSGVASTNRITIDGNGTETINGDLTKVLYLQHESYTIYSDGANWQIKQHLRPKVVFAGHRTTDQTITAASGDNTLVLTTEDKDNFGAYNNSTGIFTCPAPGDYLCNFSVIYDPSTWGVNENLNMFIEVNGTKVYKTKWTAWATLSIAPQMEFSFLATGLSADDTIECVINTEADTAADGSSLSYNVTGSIESDS